MVLVKQRMRPRHLAVAGLAAAIYALTLLVLTSAVAAPSWARPPRVSEKQVAAAVRAWLQTCATADQAYPDNCPQSAEDLASPSSSRFRWQPADPLVDNLKIDWLEPMGFFRAQGRVFMTYQHDRLLPGGALQHYRGLLIAPFTAGLRWTHDTRSFGAYEFRAGLPSWAGFTVQSFGDWRLRCCEAADLLP